MVKATLSDGDLRILKDIYIKINGLNNINILGFNLNNSIIIRPKILPELSDGKNAEYSNDIISGRSFPVKTFTNSGDRAFSLEWKFIVLKEEDIQENLKNKRILESCVYPRDEISGTPFMPPPICQIKYGKLLGDNPICAVLRSYSIKYDTSQVLDPFTMLPYRFDMTLSFEAIYASSELPGQEKIAKIGM